MAGRSRGGGREPPGALGGGPTVRWAGLRALRCCRRYRHRGAVVLTEVHVCTVVGSCCRPRPCGHLRSTKTGGGVRGGDGRARGTQPAGIDNYMPALLAGLERSSGRPAQSAARAGAPFVASWWSTAGEPNEVRQPGGVVCGCVGGCPHCCAGVKLGLPVAGPGAVDWAGGVGRGTYRASPWWPVEEDTGGAGAALWVVWWPWRTTPI